MYTEDNSKLISELYNASARQEISDILEYMGENGSSVFVYPIIDGYKKYKHSSIGYYFLWNLSRLDYPDLGRRLNELLENYEIQKEHIPIALFFMAERRFFSDIANKMAIMYLNDYTSPDFHHDFNLNSLKIHCVLEYLFAANILQDFDKILERAILSEDISVAEKAVMLNYFMEFCNDKQVDFLIESYTEKFLNTKLEVSLAKKLIFCNSESAKKIAKFMLKNGGKEAANILNKYNNRDAKSRENDRIIYSNTDAVIKIGILREQINNKVLHSDKFGFRIFTDTELLIHQSQCMDDYAVFLGLCEGLIKIIHTINPQIKGYKFSEQEKGDLLMKIPTIENGSSLSELFLYLNYVQAGIGYNFYGFRQLNGALQDIVMHKENEAFFENMKSLGIDGMYNEKNWHKLHNFFLNYYVNVLGNMNKCFNQFAKQDLEEYS